MTAAVCANCDEVVVEHGRGHVHFGTGNYRCSWARTGDGFADPGVPRRHEQELADAYEDGHADGYGEAKKRYSDD